MEQNSINPEQNTSAEQAPASAQDQAAPKKKNKKPVIIAVIIAAIALLVGGILLFKHFSDNSSDGKKKDRKKTDSSAMDDEKLDLTDYDFNGEEPTEENLYTDGPEESIATQLGVSYDDNGDFQMLSGTFDTEVSSEYDALDFLNEYSDEIGIDDVYDELELLDDRTYQDITFYKFQQVLNDVPVYGNQLIVSVNKDGIVSSVSGGYTPVDVDIEPSIDQAKAENIAKEYIGNESMILSDELVIRPYFDDSSAKLVYRIKAAGNNKYAELFLDADNGDIIAENNLLDQALETVNVNIDNKTYNIDMEKGLGGEFGDYYLTDTQRNIVVKDGRTYTPATILFSAIATPDSIPLNGHWVYAKKDADLPDGSVKLIAYRNDDPLPEDDSKDPMFTKIALTALSSVQNAYDYYNKLLLWQSIDGNGEKYIELFAGVHTFSGTSDSGLLNPGPNYVDNSFYIGSGDFDDIIHFDGTNTIGFGAIDNMPLTGKGIIGHEYTHGVVDNSAMILNDPIPKTINEGYADVMGAIISDDWLFIKNEIPPNHDNLIRNPIDPNLYGYPDKVGGDYYDDWPSDEHVNATIVSHAAYLMSQNGLSNKQIARAFIISLFKISSNPTFNKAAYGVLDSAKDLGYTDKEIEAIKTAFRSTNMLYIPHTLTVNIHCGSHPIPDAEVTINGASAGKTDKNGKLVLDFDASWIGSTEISAECNGFKDLTKIVFTICDKEKIDFDLALDKDFGAAHGSDAPISDGSNGEKIKVTIMDMSYDKSDGHSKPKGQDYYVLKGSRISLQKLVVAMKEGMEKVKDKDPELGALMGDISTDGTKIYFDTGYVPVELTYYIYGTDEMFDFSKPITEDVVIEPVIGIGDFGFGSSFLDGEDLNDLADQLDSMFNGGKK